MSVAYALLLRQLQNMDWVSRHYYVGRIEKNRPALYDKVVELLAPDELLAGKGGAVKWPTSVRIIAKDGKVKKKNTQVTLHRYFRRAR